MKTTSAYHSGARCCLPDLLGPVTNFSEVPVSNAGSTGSFIRMIGGTTSVVLKFMVWKSRFVNDMQIHVHRFSKQKADSVKRWIDDII